MLRCYLVLKKKLKNYVSRQSYLINNKIFYINNLLQCLSIMINILFLIISYIKVLLLKKIYF